MAQFSFDIVSEYDKAELNNVFMATLRDIGNRYDFKGTPASVDWLEAKTGFLISGNSEWQVDSIVDIVRKHIISRGQSPLILDLSRGITESNLVTKKEIPFLQGIDQDSAKAITRLIREQHPKLKTQIQGETVRVTGTSKDDLQAAMASVRSADFQFPTNFINFR